jgi:hypothetical protein
LILESPEFIRGEYVNRKIIDVLAYEMIKFKGFGGTERTIHTEYKPELRGKLFKVMGTKMHMTGRYVPPYSNYDSWTGEYDYEPGYLEGQKSHRILLLDDVAYGEGCIRFHDLFTNHELRIEECHVTKIEDPEQEFKMQKAVKNSHETIYTKTIRKG